MILRRFMKHVTDQNWFAVGLDVLVVITGIFLGMQVTEWNDERKEQEWAREIALRLDGEFNVIEEDLSALIARVSTFKDAALNLAKAVQRDEALVDPGLMQDWLIDAYNLGRPPQRSATYIQLLSTGDIGLLKSKKLRLLLVQYDQSIERSSFLYSETLAHLLRTSDVYAAIDLDFSKQGLAEAPSHLGLVTGYDFERLRTHVGDFTWNYFMHENNLNAATDHLGIAREIRQTLKEMQ